MLSVLRFLQLLGLAIALSPLPALANIDAAPKSWLSAKEREWIAQHPSIVLAANGLDSPSLIVEQDKPASGIIPDIIREISRVSGLQITLKTVDITYPIDTEQLKDVDMFATATERSIGDLDNFSLSRNVLQAYPTVFSRNTEQSVIRRMADLAGHRIAYRLNDALLEPALKAQGSGTRLIRVQSAAEGFRSLLENKADYYIGVSLDNYHLSNFLIADIKVAFLDNQRPIKGGFAVRNSSPELLGIIDKTLDKLGPTAIAEIASRWIAPDPESYSPSLFLNDRELNWLQQHPQLAMGFVDTLEPWLITEDGHLSGILPEIVRKLELVLGIEIDIVTGPWENLIDQAKRGQVDGLLLTSDRYLQQAGLVFTGPSFYMPRTLYARSDSNITVRRPSDLIGKRIIYYSPAVLSSPPLGPIIDQVSLHRTYSPMEALRALITGEGDVMIGATTANYLITSNNIPNVKPIYMQSNPEPYRIGVRSDWPELASIISKAMEQIGKESILDVQRRWLSTSDIRDSALTESDWAYVSQLAELKYGHRTNFPPISYLDQQGNPAGIIVDYVQLISERLGIHIKPVLLEDPTVLQRNLDDRTIDLTMVLQNYGDRSESLEFTKPYMSIPYTLVARNDVAIIQGLDDLVGKTVGVFVSSLAYSYLKNEQTNGINVRTYSDIEKAMRDIKQGVIYGFIENEVFIDYLRRSSHYSDELKFAGTLPFAYKPSIGTRKDLAKLIPILNKVLSELTEREQKLIYRRWVNTPVIRQLDWSKIAFWVSFATIIVLVFISLILYWNRKLVAARIEAENANQAKSLFLANMSHEIRTPMNAILGFAEILQEDDSLSSKHKHSLDVIQTAGNHLLSLINDILDISKIEAGRVSLAHSACEIQALLRGLEQMFQISAKNKGLSLSFENIDQLPAVINTDEGKLRQILINLIGNAVKFTQQGHINCLCEYQVLDNDQIKIIIHVSDTGPGIDEADRDKVFSTFEQTRTGLRTGGGTGLGMAISKAYAQLMGGDITLDSKPGTGSEFIFTFVGELSLMASEADDTPQLGQASIDGSKHRVLVVDDIATNRNLVTGILKPLGFTLYEAENGREAIDQVWQHTPDIVLMDIRMPEMDGITASRQIHQSHPDLPIIAMTAGVFDKDPELSRSAGFNAFLDKPFKRYELLQLLAQYLSVEIQEQQATQTASRITGTVSPKNANALKVLIVDDVPVNRLLLEKLLKPRGFQCRPCQNGREAMSEIKAWNPDLVLLDIQMPIMDGYEVLRELQHLPPEQRPPVVAITAADSSEETSSLCDLGALAVYRKPITIDSVEKIITEALASRAETSGRSRH